MAITEAIILAGGKGTRLRSVVNDAPKPMALIQGKPFIEILIDVFYKKGINRFILSVGYMANSIVDYFSNKYDDREIVFSVEESPLGTGGAIRAAMLNVKSSHVLILNGDSLLDVELDDIGEDLSLPIIFGRNVDDVSRYGQIVHDGGQVKGYHEKTGVGAGCVNAGVYIFNKNLLSNFQLDQSFSIEEAFFSKIPHDLDARLVVSNGCFIDIGLPESYALAQTKLKPYLEVGKALHGHE